MTPTPETMAEEYAAVKYEKFFGKHISVAWQEQRDAYLAGYAAALEIRSDSNQSSNQHDELSAAAFQPKIKDLEIECLGLNSRISKLAWHNEELQRLCQEKDAKIEALTKALELSARATTKTAEYFGAIEAGEYDKNRRTAPLRDYEVLVRDLCTEASLEAYKVLEGKNAT